MLLKIVFIKLYEISLFAIDEKIFILQFVPQIRVECGINEFGPVSAL